MPFGEDFKIELPFGPPPILPDIGKQLEEYLTRPEKLPIHNSKQDFKFWPRQVNFNSLYHTDVSPVCKTIKVKRDLISGELLDFTEVPVECIGQTAASSTSFFRPPGKITDDVRGSRTNYPFWPGGLDPRPEENLQEVNFNINFHDGLLTKAPGLSRGYEFTGNNALKEILKTNTDPNAEDESDIINLRNIVTDVVWSKGKTESEEGSRTVPKLSNIFSEFEDKVIPKEEIKLPILKISQPVKPSTKTEWAELLDVTKPIVDFNKRIPDPAVTWEFELDTFQKMAILKLENHEHIFVAAHTSAGKTVVAEYAIGLSQKHCSKTIYTSPIKALSNQKYRDFKKKFDEVGLITGDFQINQQAPCLIMTTEVLQSMLRAGSDVIRELEFVIFDEVHYITDTERGHVWEEVLIMLPDNVCIVMLSATVTNVLQFADWVGRTKRAKMYVVSTLKRPVPLQHYLYTGSEIEGEDICLIRDADGPFLAEGYHKVKQSALKGKGDKGNKENKGKKKSGISSVKSYLIRFAYFLKQCNKLPIIAFTLSRKQCDLNAELLMSVDLTTKVEKNAITYSFNRAIKTLKEEDRLLPQILKMGSLLENGIGVHHSGILPILKEIVEILFQKGLVKFLFATETFAMGVNMPARTVAFDSTRKYDGSEHRDLNPAEYIQMAGRAGRRGQDDTGTVIILCKPSKDLVSDINLRSMMLGLPTKLESKFRVTYSMILNSLRVKGIRVEDLMLHSFMEERNRINSEMYRVQLNELEEMEHDVPINVQNNIWYKKLETFCIDAMEYIKEWETYSMEILQNRKEMVPGRYIIITHENYINRLVLLLKVIVKTDCIEYQVLLLYNEEETGKEEALSNLYHKVLSLATTDVFLPPIKAKDILIKITSDSIKDITKFTFTGDCKVIISNCEQRQMPRFRDSPPSETCARAILDIREKSCILRSGNYESNVLSLNELKNKKLELQQRIKSLDCRKSAFCKAPISSEIPDFETQIKDIFKFQEIKTKKEDLKFKLSEKSLRLYPEFQNKIKVLHKLKYIDDEQIIQMKGKVACEMGSNELIITELIFQGVLSKFEPAEIAALLSCLVFQVEEKEDELLHLPEELQNGIQMIRKIESNILEKEREAGEISNPQLQFTLVEAVYKWAHGKLFSEIMELVVGRVQEGIIVKGIQQLNEILGDIKNAAKLFGDLVLKKKMEEASEAIKRDIVFAASLYTRDDQL